MGQDESLPAIPPGQTVLSLQKRKGDSLPYYIPPESSLKNIDCQKNGLKNFPTKLEKLEILNIAGNSLANVIKEHKEEIVLEFPRLRTIILSENDFEKLPSCFNSLKNLQVLSLERNKLTELDLKYFPNLENLNLLINYFESFPKFPETLISLNMGFNNISMLSFSLPHLRELLLPGNKITEISSSVYFPELRKLDLSYNKIYQVPPLTSFAPNLEILNVSFNILDEFPIHIPLSMKEIDVSHNAILKWEDPIVHLVLLEKLNISYNFITEVPELPPNLSNFIPNDNQIHKVFPLSNEKLHRVFFSNNKLSTIPDFSQSVIERISLTNNSIEKIDTNLLSPDVQHLVLSSGFIGEFPVSLCFFRLLNHLDLSGNHIIKLPEELHKMNSLKTLLLNENPISALPTLPVSLQSLFCCRCQFTELPESVYNIPHLQRIDFSCNRLKSAVSLPEVPYINANCNGITHIASLPDCITSLQLTQNKIKKFVVEKEYPHLQEIDVSHNMITTLALKPLHSLKTLKVAFNPVKAEIDLSMFPSIDSLDICETECFMKPDVPPPNKMREIIVSDHEYFKKQTTAQTKLFECSNAGYSEECGTRPSMEDALIIRNTMIPAMYGVIDGHGGFRASTLSAYLVPIYFAKNENKSVLGLHEVIKKLNDQLRKIQVKDGAALVICTVSSTEIGVAHLGDARALVVKKDGTIAQLTSDHKATERTEFDLVKENGAFLASGRLMGTLAVSRAIGDFAIEGVMRIPSMNTYSIKENDIRLVLACDGIFDVMTNEEVGRIAAENRDVHFAASYIRSVAFARGSQDNLSVIVVDISHSNP